MTDLGTPARQAQWDYLRNGKIHHGLSITALFLYPAVIVAGFVGGALVGILVGALIGPTAQDLLGMAGGLIGFIAAIRLGGSIPPSYGVWSGDCPHCNSSIAVTPPATAPRLFDCPQCKGRTLLDEAESRFRVHRQE
jgi:hypothetical protein